MSQNDGQRRVRTLSGVHGSACFSLLGPGQRALPMGEESFRRSVNMWAASRTLRGSVVPLLGKGTLSGSCSLLGATCYHTTAEDALLAEGSLKFIKVWGFELQALLLILRTGVRNITEYAPPTDGKEKLLASHQATNALVYFSSWCFYSSV